MGIRIVMTGGHHTSALPVIKELKKRGEAQIFWIGHKHTSLGDKNPTLEYKEITDLKIPFFELKAGKVYRNINLFRLFRVPLGVFHAMVLIAKIRPNVIISFGGYLAAPVVLAGWLLGVPSVTHEQTAVAGYANKLISKFAKKILISWQQSAKYFPKNKVVYSGLPLRREIFEVRTSSFQLNPSLPTIYITAGKTGSHILNVVVLGCIGEILDLANVIHQTGSHSKFMDFEKLNEKYQSLSQKPGKYFLRKFVEREEIGEIFSKADMIVSRAGAHTIAEVITLRKPAVLIPISWVSHNEQRKNALVAKEYGLAEILEEKDLTPENLTLEIKKVLSNIASYKPGADSEPKGFIAGDAAKIIVDEAFAAAKK